MVIIGKTIDKEGDGRGKMEKDRRRKEGTGKRRENRERKRKEQR